MTQAAFTKVLRSVAVHARRDIRRALYHLRHNGALLTFILFLGVGMWFAGAYAHRNPLVMQTMDTRAGCDVGTQSHQPVKAICAPPR